jgi:hypothetical protein
MSRSFILGPAIASLAFATAASAAPIIVDISVTQSPGNRAVVATADGSANVAWNEIANGSTSTPSRNTIANLVDTSNTPTGISILVTAQGAVSSGGRTSTTNFSGSPASSLFSAGMMGNSLAKLTTNSATVYQLSGLDADETYDFDFLASLATADTGGVAGSSLFTLVGASTTSSSIPALNNTSLLSINDIAPSSTGQITITWANSGAANYAPLNVFQFEVSPIPEPTSLAAIGLAASALLRRRRGV